MRQYTFQYINCCALFFCFIQVIPVPEGRSSKHFYVQFYDRQASGTYTLAAREYEIVPETAEDYKWRTIDAPTYVHRGHYSF